VLLRCCCRYGGDREWQAYKERTRPLLPLPARRKKAAAA
jgi:hypothetical protein